MEKIIKTIKFGASHIGNSFSYFMNFKTISYDSKDEDLKKLSGDLNNVGSYIRGALDEYQTSAPTSKGSSKTR